MKYYSKDQIVAIIDGFQVTNLSKTEWTHDAHLIVALFYVNKYSVERALSLLRKRIIKLNESNGVINSDSSGYHETITVFWLIILKKFILLGRFKSLARACNELVNSKIGMRDYLLNYYSANNVFSVKARRNWVYPDKKRLISDNKTLVRMYLNQSINLNTPYLQHFEEN